MIEAKVRDDFPLLSKQMQGHPLIYFDNAATTLKPQCVIDAVTHYYKDLGANAHRGDYELSYLVDEAYEGCRQAVADLIGARSCEIVFTSGASGSLNLVAYGYGRKFLKKGDVILSCEAEHASNILPWVKCCEEVGCVMEYVQLDEKGRLDMNDFKNKLNDRVKLVALAHVTNVLGYELEMKEICTLAHQVGAVVSVDAAQSVPHMPIDVKNMDCDFLSFSGHKMCGPTGVGVLYGKYDLLQKMDPFMLGGGSNARFDMCGNILLKEAPFKFETGTPAIEAVLGFHAAIQYLNQIGFDRIHAHEKELHAYAIEKMKQLDHVILYNEEADGGIITFNIQGIFAQDSASYFNSQGIALRAGQHCAKLLVEKLDTSATLRASFYFYNTKEEIDRFIEVCSQATIENCLNLFF